MKIKEFIENIEHTPSHLLKRKFNNLLRYKSKYKNLDKENKELLFDLVKKYKDKLRKYHRIDSRTIRLEMNKLRRKRLKENLSEEDLDDIEEILEEFKSD